MKLQAVFLGIILTIFASINAEEKCCPMHRLEPPIPLIIDTDVDISDLMAITYLIKSQKVKVHAITTVATGMAHYEFTAPHVLNLLQLLGKPTIPVSYGAKESMSPVGHFPNRWRRSIDDLMGVKLPYNMHHASTLTSSDLMTKIVTTSPTKVTILCLGPLTNLAKALIDTPKISQNIEKIVIVGGAINTPGNIMGKFNGHNNTSSEYNIALDAKAASIVFKSGIPILLVPLDATNHVPVTRQFYEELKDQENTIAAGLVAQFIKPMIHSQGGEKMYFWDPLAAALVVAPSIGYYKTESLKINFQTGKAYGSTVVTNQGVPITVTTNVNSELFYKTFLNTLCSEKN